MTFSSRVIVWQLAHGRHGLPWQGSDPYLVWVSEIMLQQTQVETVKRYFAKFIARFPDLATLAAAPLDHVLALWSGLGYYARARNLHRCAVELVTYQQGIFPADLRALAALPGIGPSTAGAILSLAMNKPAVILDGNVRRLMARHAGIQGWPGENRVASQLWEIADARLPEAEARPYSQGLMDLGAGICTPRRPDCGRCPVLTDCIAYQTDTVALIPAKRPKKPLREKHFWLLLAVTKEGVFLVKRPSKGIWAGLWCLPESAETDLSLALGDFSRSLAFEVSLESVQVQAPIKHDLTHIRLWLTPILTWTPAGFERQSELGFMASESDLDALAMPNPVSKIVRSWFAGGQRVTSTSKLSDDFVGTQKCIYSN